MQGTKSAGKACSTISNQKDGRCSQSLPTHFLLSVSPARSRFIRVRNSIPLLFFLDERRSSFHFRPFYSIVHIKRDKSALLAYPINLYTNT